MAKNKGFKDIGAELARQFDTPFDPDSMDGFDPDGDMKIFENYNKIEVDEKIITIQMEAKSIIDSMTKLFMNSTLYSDNEYVRNILKVEEFNLGVLMKQVHFCDHIVNTLMKQFDAGGYMNDETYSRILQFQTQILILTRSVSDYTRSIPNFTKALMKDVEMFSIVEAVDVSDSIAIKEGDVQLMAPQKGTTDFINKIRSEIKMAATEIEDEMREAFGEKELTEEDF